MCINSAH